MNSQTTNQESPCLNPSDKVPWKEIGECKHKIRHSLTKAVKLENLAKQIMLSAAELRIEVKAELDNMDEIIEKLGEKDAKIN